MKTQAIGRARPAISVALALALAAVPTASASADPARAKAPRTALPLYLTYDWIPERSTELVSARVPANRAAVRFRQTTFHGNGSYICTHSGAGMRSTCFRR